LVAEQLVDPLHRAKRVAALRLRRELPLADQLL
jgi:hypothetical protein